MTDPEARDKALVDAMINFDPSILDAEFGPADRKSPAPEVTDEMVERALVALMLDPAVPTGVRPGFVATSVLVIRERCDAEPIVRAALEAALNPEEES